MEYLKADLKRYFRKSDGLFSKIRKIILTQGIWATIIYRSGSWCHKNRSKVWPRILLPFLTIFKKMVEIMTGIDIPFIVDLPENAVAVGVPARVINYKGSVDFIIVDE